MWYGSIFQQELILVMKATVLHSSLSVALWHLDSQFSFKCPALMKGPRDEKQIPVLIKKDQNHENTDFHCADNLPEDGDQTIKNCLHRVAAASVAVDGARRGASPI
jgi:hypothetical protein